MTLYACPRVNEAQLQVAGIADKCLVQCTHVPATVAKFCSRLGLGPDCLADKDLERRSPVFPAEGAGLFHKHRMMPECVISIAAV